jgi:hypothetical protein
MYGNDITIAKVDVKDRHGALVVRLTDVKTLLSKTGFDVRLSKRKALL